MPAFQADASLSSRMSPPSAFPPMPAGRPGLEFAQKAFIADEGRLLLVRKSASDPHHPGRWEVPGGRLEVGADLDLDDHIRREVWEEVGIKIDPGPPFHLWQWFLPDRARGNGPGVRVVAAARLCRPVTREVTLEHQTDGDHLADCRWVPLPEVDRLDLIPGLRPVVREFRRRFPGG